MADAKAIAYFCNGLGNFIVQMPAFQAVASMAGGTVDMCVPMAWKDRRRPAVEAICEAWPVVGRLIRWPDDCLDPRRYEIWYYSMHNSRADVLQLFKDRGPAAERPGWRSSLMHEQDHYMDIAYRAGYIGPRPVVSFPLANEPEIEGPRPYIGLCNGAFRTTEWLKKTWPHFPRLAELLRWWTGGTIVGVGLEGELEGRSLDIDYCGRLSFLQTAKVVSQLDLLVTTDTAIMHLADMLDIPLVALFGPTLASKNGPRSLRSMIVKAEINCAPCQELPRFSNCEHAVCMERLMPSAVMEAVRKLL